MSRATKRKHVLNEAFQTSYDLPTETQRIVKVLSSKGNNLHEVEADDGTKYLVTMPVKFRKNIWVKRNDFILVEPIREGDKVKAEMIRTLNNDTIKYFQKENVWPTAFSKLKNDDEDDAYSFVNTNRVELSDDSSDENSDTTDDDLSGNEKTDLN